MTVQVKDQTKTVAGLLKQHIDSSTAGTLLPKDTYQDAALEAVGLSKEELVKTQKAIEALVTGNALAVGELAIDQFKANKDLERVGFETKFGQDKLSHVVDRKSVSKNPQTGEEITKFGSMGTRYVVQSSTNKGELKKVRTLVSEQAAELLNK